MNRDILMDTFIIYINGNKPYVLCVLSNDIADNEEARQTIVEISSEVYAYLNGGEKGEADGAE